MDASHPSFVAGRCADAIENRLFAPPGRGLRGARFRDLSPQPMRTIGEIVPDILERWDWLRCAGSVSSGHTSN